MIECGDEWLKLQPNSKQSINTAWLIYKQGCNLKCIQKLREKIAHNKSKKQNANSLLL